MAKPHKPKPKGYAPTVSEFMRNAVYDDVYSSYGSLENHIASLKYYQDSRFNSVIYKVADGRGWNMVVFDCTREQMEALYSNVAVNAVSQMLVRSTIWFGKEKPHFPIKGRPAIVFAWSKLGRQVLYHEMDAYPEARDLVEQIQATFKLHVS